MQAPLALRRLFGNVLVGLFAAWLALSTPAHFGPEGEYHLHADAISVQHGGHVAQNHTHGQPAPSATMQGDYQPALAPAITSVAAPQDFAGDERDGAPAWVERTITPILQPPTFA